MCWLPGCSMGWLSVVFLLLDAAGLLQRISLPVAGHCLGCAWVRFSPLAHNLCLLFSFLVLLQVCFGWPLLLVAMDPNSLGEVLSLHIWVTFMLWSRDGLLVIGLLVAAICRWKCWIVAATLRWSCFLWCPEGLWFIATVEASLSASWAQSGYCCSVSSAGLEGVSMLVIGSPSRFAC